MAASTLIKDLQHVPEIIAGLGLSISAAQSALNLDYLNAVERIIAMAKSFLGSDGANPPAQDDRDFIKALLQQLAPSRYQFTETTLSVRLNLAQRMDFAGEVGLGVGYGAVAVNASFAMAYGFDYQAAAECRTVLHAYPADGNVMDKLLARAKELSAEALKLPERHEHEQKLMDKAADIYKMLSGNEAKKIENRTATPAGNG